MVIVVILFGNIGKGVMDILWGMMVIYGFLLGFMIMRTVMLVK